MQLTPHDLEFLEGNEPTQLLLKAKKTNDPDDWEAVMKYLTPDTWVVYRRGTFWCATRFVRAGVFLSGRTPIWVQKLTSWGELRIYLSKLTHILPDVYPTVRLKVHLPRSKVVQ